MIPTTREILSAVYGAWTLFKLDPRGLEFFEDSVPGFWRSFFAAVIVAPGFVILRLIQYSESAESVDPVAAVAVEAIAYVVVWAGFPLAFYYLAQGFDKSERYVLAVVALNWSVIIQVAILLPVHVVAAVGLLPTGLATLALLAVLVVTLFYEGFVVRTALEVPPQLAALVVAVDFIISFVVDKVVDAMLT